MPNSITNSWESHDQLHKMYTVCIVCKCSGQTDRIISYRVQSSSSQKQFKFRVINQGSHCISFLHAPLCGMFTRSCNWPHICMHPNTAKTREMCLPCTCTNHSIECWYRAVWFPGINLCIVDDLIIGWNLRLETYGLDGRGKQEHIGNLGKRTGGAISEKQSWADRLWIEVHLFGMVSLLQFLGVKLFLQMKTWMLKY